MKNQGFLKKGVAFFATLTMALAMLLMAPVHATAAEEVKPDVRVVDGSVKKVWRDGNNVENMRPSVISCTFTGVDPDTGDVQGPLVVDLNAGMNWMEGGPLEKNRKWSVAETPVPGYQTEVISEDGFNFTVINTLMMELRVNKTWLGDEKDTEVRPETVEVTIYQNGQAYKTELLRAPDWTLSMNVPKYDAEDKAYVYTVAETPVANYKAEVQEEVIASSVPGEISVAGQGFTIVNTYTPDAPKEEPKEEPKPTGKTMPKTAAGVSLAAIIGLAGSAAYMARKRR
ncbi:MAG: Cna B-type domain-containing protein [Eubacteriales bacterium]|nr:Cna B-type domain-containing protein [Eubacteriales bacterium]